MKAGKMRHKVRFEKRVMTPDGMGGFEGSWQEFFTTRAQIERMQSFRFDVERQMAGGADTMPLVRINIRDRPQARQLDATMRVVDVRSGKHFNINTPPQNLDGRDHMITVSASENMPS